ncbi:MAG TPA: beta-phosphoglucomutase family hydrolase [Nocardioidaceae bacterium]|nr:beta-phosphoglucomutase family hydrolase [Nocardioidaceae bacterium]
MNELDRFDAVLLDLDGVITSTAEQHFTAWKEMFDAYLRGRSGESFDPFTRDDYNRYVDGVPRYDGVRRFLASRDIELDEGDPDDPPGSETVRSLGDRKNGLVNQIIRQQGVAPYEGTVRLLEQLRERAAVLGVVSSSRNTRTVLDVAGLSHYFDTTIDGEIAAHLGLPGKPAPDTFLAAAERLGVPAERTVVIEDALSGVQAGRAGGFGLVVGVDRVGQRDALIEHGADLVVDDLAELLN